MTVRGADDAAVRDALRRGDALSGLDGFAGELDGRLVRDVLGREPLFFERSDPARWAFDRRDLTNPRALPAGRVRTLDTGGDERALSLPTPPVERDHGAALEAVREAVVESVRDVAADGLAVAFSGGVDSAVVAAGVSDAPCYVAGFPGAHDIEAAERAAESMGRDLRVVELSHADLTRAVPELVSVLGRTNPMDLQIALPLYLVAERAAADGYDRLALGQGADELFGGYAKVAKAPEDPRVEATTVRGATREVIRTLPEQLTRDVSALRAAGVDPVTPLLSDRVVRSALSLSGALLVRDGERKVALRRAATAAGVPEAVAAADKKAVQYGTYVSRELDRLARRAGFKRRMENHVERYVRSLCA